MPERTDQPPEQPTPGALTPQPNRILAEPATVDTCASDLRTPQQQVRAMAEAAAQRGSIGQGGDH